MTENYVDLVEAGIIDPAKVTRSALENAASVAGMILTTEALVTDLPEKKSAAPAARWRAGHVRLTSVSRRCEGARGIAPRAPFS